MEQPTTQRQGSPGPGASPGAVRGTAICAGLSGLFLTGYAVLMALKPAGSYIGYRDSGPIEATLILAGLALLVVAALGFFQVHRFEGRAARVVRIAALAAAVALLIGTLGLLINGFVFQGNSGLVYLGVAFPGLLLGMVSFATVGFGLLRTRVLPAWSGVALALTSLLLLAFNTEDNRVLVMIPFGMTLMILAGLLWSTAASPSTGWRGRIQHA